MATKSKTFKAAGDTGVTVYAADASGNSIPVRIEPGDSYETDDKAIIAALEGSPEVTTVKDSKK